MVKYSELACRSKGAIVVDILVYKRVSLQLPPCRESRKKERACVRESALQLHFIPQRGATLLFELRGHLKNLPRPAHSRLGRTSLQMREAIGSEEEKKLV